MDTCLIIGIIKGLILLIIGVAGVINVDYIANIYVAIVLIIIGLLVFAAAYNHREKRND